MIHYILWLQLLFYGRMLLAEFDGDLLGGVGLFKSGVVLLCLLQALISRCLFSALIIIALQAAFYLFEDFFHRGMLARLLCREIGVYPVTRLRRKSIGAVEELVCLRVGRSGELRRGSRHVPEGWHGYIIFAMRTSLSYEWGL